MKYQYECSDCFKRVCKKEKGSYDCSKCLKNISKSKEMILLQQIPESEDLNDMKLFDKYHFRCFGHQGLAVDITIIKVPNGWLINNNFVEQIKYQPILEKTKDQL